QSESLNSCSDAGLRPVFCLKICTTQIALPVPCEFVQAVTDGLVHLVGDGCASIFPRPAVEASAHALVGPLIFAFHAELISRPGHERKPECRMQFVRQAAELEVRGQLDEIELRQLRKRLAWQLPPSQGDFPTRPP